MKLISWNVNGLRACLKKGFGEFFLSQGADVFCLQETKMQPGEADFDNDGYHAYYHSAVKKGYSGTAVFTKEEPIAVHHDFPDGDFGGEGRVLALEMKNYILVNVYSPNSQQELARLSYRMKWQDAFVSYLRSLDSKKPLVICGDLNVAHTEDDIKNPKQNEKSAGFSVEEREKMTELLSSGFTDTFRRLYPEKRGAYTWWSYMFKARERNAGWRIDYFLVSDRIFPLVRDSIMYPDVYGSDHCPIGLLIDIG